jgi:DNA invertase Pin-like site-specific DNA recombinase
MGMKHAAPTIAPKFVSYARVSTEEQGRSGLGLEAQAAAITAAVADQGGIVTRAFVEIASGDDDERPQLAAALKLCRRTGATLIVAKLDRLSRAVAMVAGLMREGVAFRVAELENASTLEIHLRATIAEEERRLIAARTTAALAAAKARGTKLGSSRPGHWKGREQLRSAGQRKAVKAAAAKRLALSAELYREAFNVARGMPDASLRAIAAALDDAGITTPKGSKWTAAAVSRMLAAAC